MLGYRDSGMPGTPANQHLDAFVQADPSEAAGRLVRIIRELRPRVIVTEPPGGGYAHPDHIMCHQVSLAAFHAVGDARAYRRLAPRGQWPSSTLLPRLMTASGRPCGPRSRRPASTWEGDSGRGSGPAAPVRRPRRWPSMSGRTARSSAKPCWPIGRRFRRTASGDACLPRCTAVLSQQRICSVCTRQRRLASTSRICSMGCPCRPGRGDDLPRPSAQFLPMRASSWAAHRSPRREWGWMTRREGL